MGIDKGSGPFGSAYFDHPWMFDAYIPDVIVRPINPPSLLPPH